MAVAPSGPEVRRVERFAYLVPCGINVRVKQPGGSDWQHFLIRPRNLSRHGIAFFHGGYLHNDTYCEVSLRKRDGSVTACPGHVVHCRFIAGRVHEIGLRFQTPIDVRQYVGGGQTSGAMGDEPCELVQGRVLCAEGNLDDRALLKFQLSELGATVVDVADGIGALERIHADAEAFDLVVLGEELGEMDASAVAAALRAGGHRGGIVQWAAVTSPASWRDGLLPKPFRPDEIRAMVERCLQRCGEGSRATPLESALWSKRKMRPLILNYLETLEEQAVRLSQLIDEQDTSQLMALVRQMRGSAGSYGYAAITEAGEAVLKEAEGEASRALVTARELVTLCQRACAFRSNLNYDEL